MYRVLVTNPERDETREYRIEELQKESWVYPDAVIGDLVYCYSKRKGGYTEGLPVMPWSGFALFTRVSESEAEAITGLHMPAAMDRLRELVHESGGTS